MSDRRCHIDRRTFVERAIDTALAAVEGDAAHPLMTDASELLTRARDKVGDYVDHLAPGELFGKPVHERRFFVKVLNGRCFVVDRDDDRPIASSHFEEDANSVAAALNLVSTSRSQPARPKQ